MTDLKLAFQTLRDAAAAYPESYEESPWGELAAKVRKKVFVFLGRGDGTRLGFSLKIPDSRARALELPQASPTGYGLGRHGWVSFSFEPGADVPMERVLDWLDESYRNVAPKTLVRRLEHRQPVDEPSPAPTDLAGRRLLLVGDDPLRLERAQEALGARGADVVCTPLAQALDAAGAGAPDAVVVDLSRNAQQAIALLADLGLICESPLIVAGIRNAKMERELEGHEGLGRLSREPPGDPGFVDALAGDLA